MKSIHVGLLGCGTVGTGVARLLMKNREVIRARLGAELVLTRAADIDAARKQDIPLPDDLFTTDAGQVLTDPRIDIVVELIGGEGVAKEFILRAIGQKKHVVTANKALLAKHGRDLFSAAMKNGVDLAMEASCGGCMPVVKVLRESLAGNRLYGMTGILNGTCNYILTQITDRGLTYEEALGEAQREGFAEADPTMDVQGHDSAHKLAILSSLAYGIEIDFEDLYIEGITGITPVDIQFADEFDYRIKLLAISKNHGDTVETRVHPTMIPKTNILSSVVGALNAITITGDAAGDILLYGKGAGMMPTASAVVSDLVDIARNMLCGCPPRIPLLSFQREQIRKLPVRPISEIFTHYYFRFAAMDRPGVLSKISGILGENSISIKSVQQKGRKSEGAVPIVMLTHLAREADVRKAFSEISKLDVVMGKPMLIRIEDENDDE
jgi:homoserine dehydrogenase